MLSGEEKRNQPISVLLDPPLREMVERLARAERRSISNYVANVIATAVAGEADRGVSA